MLTAMIGHSVCEHLVFALENGALRARAARAPRRAFLLKKVNFPNLRVEIKMMIFRVMTKDVAGSIAPCRNSVWFCAGSTQTVGLGDISGFCITFFQSFY